MSILSLLPMATIFGIANRGRGSKLWGYTDSTVISRLSTAAIMALICSFFIIPDTLKMLLIFVWSMASLMLWMTPAWDSLWGAELGRDPIHSRLWGLMHMGLRMTLAAPFLIGLAFLLNHPITGLYALGTPLLALPYYIVAYLKPKGDPIMYSEYSVGAILGGLAYLTII